MHCVHCVQGAGTSIFFKTIFRSLEKSLSSKNPANSPSVVRCPNKVGVSNKVEIVFKNTNRPGVHLIHLYQTINAENTPALK